MDDYIVEERAVTGPLQPVELKPAKRGPGRAGRPKGYTHKPGRNADIEHGFANDGDSNITIQHETPKHRLCIYLAMLGRNHTEIAKEVGFTPQYVSDVLAQPWARERIVNEQREAGQGELRRVLSAEGLPALKRIIDLSKFAHKEQTQLAANCQILDRLLGKPNQPYSNETKPAEQLSDEELNARIQQLSSGPA